MAAFTATEIADRLGEAQARVTKALKAFVLDGTARTARRGRETVYFHADHPLRPEYGLFGPVEAVKLMIFEPEARRRAESQRTSSMLETITFGFMSAAEEIISQRLAYFPLYKVHFKAAVREGWLFRHEVERIDNLYFNALTSELLSYQGNSFAFPPAADVPSNPVAVVDLDNLAIFEWRSPGELELDDAEMTDRVTEKQIDASAARKFQLSVLAISPVFFPVWRFRVRDKQNNSQRELNIDGLKGQPITLGRPTTPAKKRK